MLNEIGGKQNIPGFLSRVKDKQDHTRLMGFGHRVYKNYDPRAKVMRQTCHEVLTALGIEHDPLLELAMELEQIALKDDYFISQQALSQRRLLLGHHLPGDRHPDLDVHRAVRRRAHRRLDRAVERDDRGSGPEDRPAAPALQRPDRAALQAAALQCGDQFAIRGKREYMARSSHGPRLATTWAVARSRGRCRAIVRLGRPANDNSAGRGAACVLACSSSALAAALALAAAAQLAR